MLPEPTLVNIKTGAEYDQYIGLGSPWGNRFSQEGSRPAALKSYEHLMRMRLRDDAGWRVDLKALAGKRLGCHCAPKPCHGDVLIKLFKELRDGKMELNDKGTTSGAVGQ